MSSSSPARIDRREYKYLIDEDTAARVREAIAPFCVLDGFAEARADRRYIIDSLYFDTPDLRLFRANEHEVADRFKARARTYPESATAPVFFEIKRRIGDVIAKTRGRVSRDHWAEALERARVPQDDRCPPRDRPAVERFFALAWRYHLRPVVLVRYEREPWMSVIDSYARVTFDYHVRSQAIDRLTFDHAPNAWRASDHPEANRADRSLIILELKFTTHVPMWLVHIVERFDLWRQSFSKYGTSVQAWHLPASLRTSPRLAT